MADPAPAKPPPAKTASKEKADVAPRTLEGVGRVVPVTVATPDGIDHQLLTLEKVRQHKDNPTVKLSSWQEYSRAHADQNLKSSALGTLATAVPRGLTFEASDLLTVAAAEAALGREAGEKTMEAIETQRRERPGLSFLGEMAPALFTGGRTIASKIQQRLAGKAAMRTAAAAVAEAGAAEEAAGALTAGEEGAAASKTVSKAAPAAGGKTVAETLQAGETYTFPGGGKIAPRTGPGPGPKYTFTHPSGTTSTHNSIEALEGLNAQLDSVWAKVQGAAAPAEEAAVASAVGKGPGAGRAAVKAAAAEAEGAEAASGVVSKGPEAKGGSTLERALEKWRKAGAAEEGAATRRMPESFEEAAAATKKAPASNFPETMRSIEAASPVTRRHIPAVTELTAGEQRALQTAARLRAEAGAAEEAMRISSGAPTLRSAEVAGLAPKTARAASLAPETLAEGALTERAGGPPTARRPSLPERYNGPLTEPPGTAALTERGGPFPSPVRPGLPSAYASAPERLVAEARGASLKPDDFWGPNSRELEELFGPRSARPSSRAASQLGPLTEADEAALRTLQTAEAPKTLPERAPPTVQEGAPPTVQEGVPPTLAEDVPPTVQEGAPPTLMEEGAPTAQEGVPPTLAEDVPPTVQESGVPTMRDEAPPTVIDDGPPPTLRDADMAPPTVREPFAPAQRMLDHAREGVETAYQKLARQISDARGVYPDFADMGPNPFIQAAAVEFNNAVFQDREFSVPAMIAGGVLGALGILGLNKVTKWGAKRSALAELAEISAKGSTAEGIEEQIGFIKKTVREMAFQRADFSDAQLQGMRKLDILDDVAENLTHEFPKVAPKGKSIAKASPQDMHQVGMDMANRYGDIINGMIDHFDAAAAAGKFQPPPAAKMMNTLQKLADEVRAQPGGVKPAERIEGLMGEWMRTQGMLITNAKGDVIGADLAKPLDMKMAKKFSTWARTVAWAGDPDPDIQAHMQYLVKTRDMVEHHIASELDLAADRTLPKEMHDKYTFAKRKAQSWIYIRDAAEQHIVDHLKKDAAKGGPAGTWMKLIGRTGYGLALGGDPGIALAAAAASLVPEWYQTQGRALTFSILEKVSGGVAVAAERQSLMAAAHKGAKDFIAHKGVPPTRVPQGLSQSQATKAIQNVRSLQNNPGQVMGQAAKAAQPIMALDANAGMQTMQGIQKALTMLAARLPQTIWDADGGVPKKAMYNPWELKDWLEYYDAVTTPETLPQNVARGYVSPRQVEIIREVMPEYLTAVQDTFMAEFARRRLGGVQLTMEQQAAISALMERPMSQAMSPKSIKSNQTTYSQLSEAMPGPGGNGGGGTRGTGGGGSFNFGNMFATSVQSRAMKGLQ